MRTHNFFPIIISAIILTSFSPAEQLLCRHTGIKGHVYLVTGNQMPSPDQQPLPPKGVKTMLYIFSLTNINEVNREGNSAFYKSISSGLVKQVETDENGYFKTKLKAGLYSLFVKKGDLFYSGQFDEKNNIHPVEVRKGKTTEVVFRANYDALY